MILLDTQVLLWWVSGGARLSEAATKAIGAEQDGGSILVSSISAWEIAQLVARVRLALASDVAQWLAVVDSSSAVAFIPVDREIAVKSVGLPGSFHRGPADRIIVATARKLSPPIVTAEGKSRAIPPCGRSGEDAPPRLWRP